MISNGSVVLAFGSNKGDRVRKLSSALALLIRRKIIEAPIRVSSVYVSKALTPKRSPAEWQKEFLNFVLEAKSSLEPVDLLGALKKIEAELGREPAERWSPRVIDIDLLYYKNKAIRSDHLELPHPEIFNRDFVLKPLAELYPNQLEFQKALDRGGFGDSCIASPLKILPTQLVGILNFTPDSFSDGGEFFETSRAKEKIQSLIQAGASIIDVGAESTRPGAKSLTADEEWIRLSEIVSNLKSQLPSWVSWSMDSRHSQTMQKALEFGASHLNDVSAAGDEKSIELWASSDRPVVFMHHMGIPVDRDQHIDPRADPVEVVLQWAHAKLELFQKAGISKERLIFDPGIGFGKTAYQSLEILNRLKEFQELELPIYVGHSRKSFLNLLTNKDFKNRDIESAVISSKIFKDCDFLRVHEPEVHQRAILSALLMRE